MGGASFGLGYHDVDGDGNLEIVTEWEWGNGNDAMTILNMSGEELTRQACADDNSTDDPAGVACPIEGIRVVLQEPQNEKTDILSYRDRNSDYHVRYSLVRGHYVLQKQSRPLKYSKN
jgi:hypothetical protein